MTPSTPRRFAPVPARALAVGLVVGAALGAGTSTPVGVSAIVLCGLALWALGLHPTRSRGSLALFLVAVAVGTLRGAAALPAPAPDAATDRPGVIRGVVDDVVRVAPDVDGSRELILPLRLGGGRRAVVRVRHAADETPVVPAPGDEVEVRGLLAVPRRPGNPGERDRRAALRREGTVLFARASGPAAVRRTGGRERDAMLTLRRIGARLRATALRRLDAACGDDTATAHLLGCLLVGDRSGLDEATLVRFRRAGAAHLLAVSGLHVVLLVGTTGALLQRAADAWMPGRAGRALALVTSLVALVLYALACRLATPVVRASVFVAVALVARAAGRRTGTADHLAIAAAIVAAAAPTQVLSAGFHLSFAAVAGLCWLTGRFREALFAHWDLLARFPEALPPWRLRAMRWLAAGASASLAASTATAPVSAAVFGQIHLAAPLTNLLAVPLAGLLLPAAAVATALGGIAPGATSPLLGAGAACLDGAVGGVAWLPGATIQAGAGSWAVALSILLLTVAAALRPWERRHLLLPLAAWIVLLPTADGRIATAAEATSGPGALAFDVGHGLAVLVRGGEGGTLLFDSGARLPGAAERILVPALAAVGVRRLTAIAVSHEDADHCGAVPDVLAALPVGAVLVPAGFGGDPAGRRVLAACARHSVPVVSLARDDRFETHDLRVLAVLPLPRRPGPVQNEGSLVLHVTAGDPQAPPETRLTALLPGDVEGPALDALAADPTLPAAEFLLLPHHGRGAPAPLAALARRLQARVTVASTPTSAPTALPGAYSTGDLGALWIAPRRAPVSLRPDGE